MIAVLAALTLFALSALFMTGDAEASGVDRATQEKINAAIHRGAGYLRDHVEDFPLHEYAANYPHGVDCLAYYTLLMCGVSPDAAFLHPLERRARLATRDVDHTYTLSLALLGLLAADAPRNRQFIVELLARFDAGQIKTGNDAQGGWGYVLPQGPTVTGDGDGEEAERHPMAHWDAPAGWFDNSNTQYAILAQRAAVDYGFLVDRAVFQNALRHLLRQLNSDGGCGYTRASQRPRSDSYVAMTAGVVGSIVMCADVLPANVEARALRRHADAALRNGAGWMGRHLRFPPTDGPWPFYSAYSVERFGHYAHLQRFGRHDWYAQGVRWLLGTQLEDGSWSKSGVTGAAVGRRNPKGGRLGKKNRSRGQPPLVVAGDPVTTCFALLFLKRASFAHTIMSDEILVLLRNLDPQAREQDLARLRSRILEVGDRAVPQLVKGLYLPNELAQELSDTCLRKLTGKDFGFSDANDEGERRRAREQWVRHLMETDLYGKVADAESPDDP